MRLGAQLFSVRKKMQTEAEMDESLGVLKSMGYETVQLSGLPAFAPEFIDSVMKKHGFDIPLTHTGFDRIVNETEQVIAEHKMWGCPVVGLGMMPKEYRNGTKDGLEKFFALIAPAVEKIEEAGLRFAYHNHAFEFEPLTDTDDGELIFDIMIEEKKNWLLILDTYWVAFAGKDVCEYLRRIGSERLVNVHFKDMAKDEARSICACGDGVLDFEKIYSVCKELGVQNVFVEQDNAHEFGDPLEQMQISYDHLRPIVE